MGPEPAHDMSRFEVRRKRASSSRGPQLDHHGASGPEAEREPCDERRRESKSAPRATMVRGASSIVVEEADQANKPVSALRQRLYVRRTSGVVLQGAPDLADAIVEALVEVDPCAVPDFAPQFVACDDLSVARDQEREHTGRLWLKRNLLAAAPQMASCRSKGERAERDGIHEVRDGWDIGGVPRKLVPRGASMTSTAVAAGTLLSLFVALLQVPPSMTQPQTQTLLPTLPPAPIVPHRVTVLREWVAAVQRHVPGEVDAGALVPSIWTADEVVDIWTDAQVFAALLNDPTKNRFVMQPGGRNVNVRPDTLAAMRELALVVRARMPPDLFFKRAALLHTDVVTILQRDEVTPSMPASMLIPQRLVIRTEDGQQLSIQSGSVHWEFARVLLDAVFQPSRDEFVRRWYRATLTHKLAKEELDTPHFEHGLRHLANDAPIQFLLGCLHEAFADPRALAATRNLSLPPRTILAFGSEESELGEARDFFRRALALDPTSAETRLHYGRVLGRLGRHKEAAAELRLALAGTRDPLLTYFAQLFVGAEEEALGRHSEARTAYEEALSLHPRAQAPRLALSQLAHRSGDRASARAALARVLQPPDKRSENDDPWWEYRTLAGRNAAILMGAVQRLVRGDEPP